MDDDTNMPRYTEKLVLEQLRLSELDVACGRVAPWAEVRARLMVVVEEYEAKRARQEA